MKKLSKLKLKAFTEMNDDEMKNVVGGYGYGYGGYNGGTLPEVVIYGEMPPGAQYCAGKRDGDSCNHPTRSNGVCRHWPQTKHLVCWGY